MSYPGGKKCSFFGKFGVLCFLVTSVLRFSSLPSYRQFIVDCNQNLCKVWWELFYHDLDQFQYVSICLKGLTDSRNFLFSFQISRRTSRQWRKRDGIPIINEITGFFRRLEASSVHVWDRRQALFSSHKGWLFFNCLSSIVVSFSWFTFFYNVWIQMTQKISLN